MACWLALINLGGSVRGKGALYPWLAEVVRPELELQGAGKAYCDCACLAVIINSLDT